MVFSYLRFQLQPCVIDLKCLLKCKSNDKPLDEHIPNVLVT